MKGLFLFSIFVIIYGSLFPFDFHYVGWLEEGRYAFFSHTLSEAELPDILGNIILFLPYGFAGSELITRNHKQRKYYLALFIIGIFLAISLQVLQVYLPGRVPALYDAIWNSVGLFFGVFLARVMRLNFPGILASDDRMALLALIISWIIFLLVPFFFEFNMEILKENIAIHLDMNEHRFANVIFYVAIWITYTKLIDEIHPTKRNVFLSLDFSVIIMLSAKIFVYRDFIEPELLSGGVIAILLMHSHLFDKISPYKTAAMILVPVMFYNSLYPFEFYSNPFKEFMWIPFSELFSDDMLPIIRTVFYKVFAYGAIVWTFYKSFPNAKWINYFCLIYAGSIEYLQHLTLTRIGGLTEPLIVLFLITFIHQKPKIFNLYDDAELPADLDRKKF
ncbi:MAG: VanZ family protein [Kordiimonadaceae bacterium]|nr:VanZ family protein [Kordiimonadaceae bacterium]